MDCHENFQWQCLDVFLRTNPNDFGNPLDFFPPASLAGHNVHFTFQSVYSNDFFLCHHEVDVFQILFWACWHAGVSKHFSSSGLFSGVCRKRGNTQRRSHQLPSASHVVWGGKRRWSKTTWHPCGSALTRYISSHVSILKASLHQALEHVKPLTLIEWLIFQSSRLQTNQTWSAVYDNDW